MRVKEKSKKAGLKLSFQKPKMLAYGPISSWQIDRRKGKQRQVLFSWSPRKLYMVTAAMKLKDTCYLEEKV